MWTRSDCKNKTSFIVIAALGCTSVACTDSRTPSIRTDSTAVIVPRVPCSDSGGALDLNIEVIPELSLMCVTGLPLDHTASPQLVLFFHLSKIRELRRDVNLEIYVSAESSLGKLLVGFARVTQIHPQPRLWRPNTCFPVACDVNLPLATSTITWHLEARIRSGPGKAVVVSLGDVRLLAGCAS